MTDSISMVFLRDSRHGGPVDQAATVAADFAAFVDAATTSVDIAIYDFRLDKPEIVATVVGALTRAAGRGVAVRIGFDAGKPAAATAEDFAAMRADPAPVGTADWVAQHFAGTGVQTRPIRAGGQLMHSKYVIRDAPTAPAGAAAVWTGSTNFTDDAWTRQENNIITVASGPLAAAYRVDFDEMWTSGTIKNAGRGDAGTAPAGGGEVGWDFCPGDGKAINTALASRINAATGRILIGAMVLTSRDVLAALADALARGIALDGIYDGGQMDPIVRQWKAGAHSADVLADWHAVAGHLAHKQSVPYSPTSVHNFMHLKVLITDDTVTTGSYNFSANAERNAENQLHLTDPDTVAAYTDFLKTVIQTYR
jgi:phosphatidylserine/phosphatidylglycerophosphate/cardiolipin synthase-like enzyme